MLMSRLKELKIYLKESKKDNNNNKKNKKKHKL